MKNVNNNQIGQNTGSQEIYAAKLSLIGSALSTIGDGLQTIAAGITLQELENPNNQNPQNQLGQSNELELMQKQIEQLTRKIERMERIWIAFLINMGQVSPEFIPSFTGSQPNSQTTKKCPNDYTSGVLAVFRDV